MCDKHADQHPTSHLLRQTGTGPGKILHVRLGPTLSLIQHKVCGHFALQTGDVAMAEIITQVVHLGKKIYLFIFTDFYFKINTNDT